MAPPNRSDTTAPATWRTLLIPRPAVAASFAGANRGGDAQLPPGRCAGTGPPCAPQRPGAGAERPAGRPLVEERAAEGAVEIPDSAMPLRHFRYRRYFWEEGVLRRCVGGESERRRQGRGEKTRGRQREEGGDGMREKEAMEGSGTGQGREGMGEETVCMGEGSTHVSLLPQLPPPFFPNSLPPIFPNSLPPSFPTPSSLLSQLPPPFFPNSLPPSFPRKCR
ncbi:unnamed protein product [Closterium sp. NIES-64]|nr:unnamed protein product [Closterium sp. NIES-64]